MARLINKNEALGNNADSSSVYGLGSHLGLLQVFLPTDCWLIGRFHAQSANVVATWGGVPSDFAKASRLALLLSSGWDAPGKLDQFCYRSLSRDELTWLAAVGSFRLLPRFALRAKLRVALGEQSVQVLGLLSDETVPQTRLAANAREIALCLTALEQTLSLKLDLIAAHERVRETQRHAYTDSLTQVLNRTGWSEHLCQTLNTDDDAAIAFVDLDCLKYVNDTRGHQAGDKLLQLTANAILSVLRNSDCVARLGGDEFAIMLPAVSAADAMELKGRLRQALHALCIRASIGVALKSEAGSLQDAMHLADRRMYQEKKAKQSLPISSDTAFNLE